MKKTSFLRMDDVGASSKQFEIYSRFFVGNFLFLKYIWPFKSWGPYPELNVKSWKEILNFLGKEEAKMTVGITASWVEKDGRLIPFPKKFPKEAKIIKMGLKDGLLEIANHGLTHCIVGKHPPRLFFPNRKFHREFYDWVAKETQIEHIRQSQEILQSYFDCKVVTFIPPGGVWTKITEKTAFEFGLKLLCAHAKLAKTGRKSNGILQVSDDEGFSFHDRDVIYYGVLWLKNKLKKLKKRGFNILTVKEFARS